MFSKFQIKFISNNGIDKKKIGEFWEFGTFSKNEVSEIHPNFEISENRKIVDFKKSQFFFRSFTISNMWV
jgi:hypothetical protein